VGSHELIFNSEKVTAVVNREAGQFSVTVDGKVYELRQIGPGLFGYLSGSTRSVIAAVRHKGVCYLDIDSIQLELSEPGSEDFTGGSADLHAGQKDKIFAPMPGKIVKIMVAVGEEVEIKQPMVIVEAMKMENQVNSRAKGTVRAIHFAAGDQVDTERPIIELDIKE
jgi:biotin carboxyl carrier protein